MLPEEELFKELLVEFEKAGIHFLLIGGYAVNAYGYSRTTEEETFQNIIKDAKGIEVMGRKLLVPSAEHLIALKLHAIKNDPKRETKDLNDVFELIKAKGLDVRSSKFKDFCLKFGNAGLFERIQKWAGTRT